MTIRDPKYSGEGGGAALDTAPSSAGQVVARLARHLERGLAATGLSLPQYRILGLLGEGTSASSALAERLALSPPSITSVVDGLVTRGLVTRGADPADRRRLPLVLTPDGAELLREADAAVDARLGAVAAHLPDAQDATEALDRLRAWRTALDGFRVAQAPAQTEAPVRTAAP
jgi:DNA-binding MarR family transcriptional regulator